MNDTKQPVSEKSPEYLAATLREVAETLTDVGKTINARLAAWAEAAPEPEPEPEPPCVHRWEYDQDGGSWACQNCGAIHPGNEYPPAATQEPEPPSVEVMSAATGALRRYKSITSFVRRGAMWEVYGDTTVGGGTVHTMTTPFAIWQECIAAGVPCCDPPYADLTLNIGDRWRVFSIMELRVSPHTGNSFIRCIGNRPDYGARYAVENTYYVTESPAAIRALCDAAGVPRPEEEPKTVRINRPGKAAAEFAAVSSISAVWRDDCGPCLRIVGDSNGDAHIHTRTPLADIRAQAEAAGMKLPPVTVRIVDNTYTGIKQVRCEWCDIMHEPATSFVTDDGDVCGTDECTPAQVVRLCELAGWPKPEVRMVLTYADGDPCEVDPCEDIGVEYDAHWHATSIAWVRRSRDNRYEHRIVREPVAVVEQMLAACKEGE